MALIVSAALIGILHVLFYTSGVPAVAAHLGAMSSGLSLYFWMRYGVGRNKD